MKLQDAYVSEANAIGNWARIGYKMDDTPNFDYIEGLTYSDDGTILLTATLGKGWSAKNKVAMNDCTVASGVGACEWSLTMAAESTGNGLTWTSAVTDAGKMLTPSFTNIGK